MSTETETRLCRQCGTPERPQTPHAYPAVCMGNLQDRAEIAEQAVEELRRRLLASETARHQGRDKIAELERERDRGIDALTEFQLQAVAEREKIERQRDEAQADAAQLRATLQKFRIVISGYARASESHLPEVDAALNNGKDPLAGLLRKKDKETEDA